MSAASAVPSIGIVFCNYNKSHYVVNCIQSVLESDTKDYEVYVVDNASTDDSVPMMRQKFKNKIKILINEENMGGSGGFNRGIREVLKAGHPYIMCLDNDVLVDESAVSTLHRCMQRHPQIGMLGSRVYHMQDPRYVRQFGSNIDFDNYIVETLYADAYEDGSIPELVYCDTAATCSVMVRSEAVRKAGMMPEDNFIYWDDMEWGWRIRTAGWKVAAYGASKVLHAKGADNRNNAVFTSYYNVRNRIHFFLKYIKEGQIEDFAKQMLESAFDSIYERMYRDEHNTALAVRYALDDAVHGVYGKGGTGRLNPADTLYQGIEQLLAGKAAYYIEENGHIQLAGEIREYIREHCPQMRETNAQACDVVLSLCDYVMLVRDFSFTKAYVDEHYNVFSNADEAELIKNYYFSKELFLYMNQLLFMEQVQKQRKGKDKTI